MQMETCPLKAPLQARSEVTQILRQCLRILYVLSKSAQSFYVCFWCWMGDELPASEGVDGSNCTVAVLDESRSTFIGEHDPQQRARNYFRNTFLAFAQKNSRIVMNLRFDMN